MRLTDVACIATKFNANNKSIAELCKGSTADSDSVCLGSNPSSAAKTKETPLRCLFCFVANRRFEPSFLPIGQELGSHTPLEVRQARLSGAESGYLRHWRIP